MENQKYCCTLCQLDFTTSSNLRKHERTEKHIKLINKIESEKIQEKQMSIKDLELQVVELKTILSEVLERMKVMEGLLCKDVPTATLASLPELVEVEVKKRKKTPKMEPVIQVNTIESMPVVEPVIQVNPIESTPVLEPVIQVNTIESIPVVEPEIQVNPNESMSEKPKKVKKLKIEVIPIEKQKSLREVKAEVRTLLDNTCIGNCKCLFDEYFLNIQSKYKQVMSEWYDEYYETRLNKNTIVYKFK